MKFFPLVWRNLVRNKLRSALTGGAIMLAIALVCLLRTMPAGLDAVLASMSANTRISIHHEAGLVYPLPYAYLQKVRAIPGVVAATSWSWFGGAFEIEKGVTFPNFSVDPESIAAVYKDHGIDPEVLANFQRYRDGAIVGHGTLERYGWKRGDIVTLQSTAYPVTLSFRILGEDPSTRAPQFWFRRDYLEQALLAQGRSYDTIGMIWARVDDAARVQPIMREITEMFRNSEAEVSVETEKSFFGNMMGNLQGFMTIILIVTGLVTLCILFIAANTASMSVRERAREIAILKAIGFRRRLVFGTLLGEATMLSTAAGVLGAAASIALTLAVRSAVGTGNPLLGPLTSFIVTNAILVQAVFLGLFVGILSGYVPSWGAARRSVAATLREVF